jgi:cobalt-zinc-cadmium efflux system membrane fusion protein
MDEVKPVPEKQETPELPVPAPSPGPTRRRYAVIAVAVLALLLIAAAIVRRENAGSDETPGAQPAPAAPNDAIEANAEQVKQIRVEPVREQMIDLDLETTGKVGFNEDRMTPVFAPYGGRVLEVLANKGDLVKPGQALLIVESPDLVAAVNDLSEARSNVDKARIALDTADKAAQRAHNLNSLGPATWDLQAAESGPCAGT